MVEKRKVVLVGTGFVGMSMAYSLLNQGGVDELVLIDIDKNKTMGEAMDLNHGLPFASSRMEIYAGDYKDCKDANLVVITAGASQKPGQTRLELAQINAKIMKDITKQVVDSGFDGIFLIASNPVDLMTYVVQKVSGFPANRVIGSGTVLDTARLRYIISDYLSVSPKNIHAYIMGEHGDSSFVPWTHCYVGSKSLLQIMKERGETQEKLDEIHQQVRDAAYQIIQYKKATYYAIGISLTRIIKAILNNENAILTVSTYLQGQYGIDGIYIGVPAVINNTGITDILTLPLTKEEQEKLEASANILKEMIQTSIHPVI